MTLSVDIERYRRAAAAVGARPVVIGADERHEELVLRGARVESRALTTESGVVLAYGDDHRTYVAADASSDPAELAQRADRVLRLLGSSGRGPAAAEVLPALPAGTPDPRSSLADGVEQLEDALRPLGDVDVELRATSRQRHVGYVDDQRHGYRSAARTSVLLRVTSRDGGRTTHLDHAGVVGHPQDVARLLADELVPKVLGELSLPSAPPLPGPWPELVVLDGEVAAQLMALASKSFSAESVHQRRSALGELLDGDVAAPVVSVIDDPAVPGAPEYGAFDDEGVPTGRRALVEGGRLLGFLGTRELERTVPGAVRGNAWQSSRVSPPRPNGSCLHVRPASAPLPPDASSVRVVQSHGLHMANDITGDFSLGATAVVTRADGPALVTGLTVAGNVLRILRDVVATGDRVAWSPGSVATYGAPDLLVSGLAIGS